VHEGPKYTISSVEIRGAPEEQAQTLRGMIHFHEGADIQMEPYRLERLHLALHLQEHGYGHARVYSRAFVDRETKHVAWVYYVDAGPKTTIGSIQVVGNAQVPADEVLARAGLKAGEPFSTERAQQAELALLDTGAFVTAAVVTDADIARLPEFPDTGGVLAPEQVDANGELVPRDLPAELTVRVMVAEAPRRQLRAEIGVEADPNRFDAFTGARVTLRNLLGVQHHLVLEGNVGYGWRFDEDQVASGLYGSALVQYLHPGDHIDGRITGRWRDTLYPDALLREFTVGPGLRAVPAEKVMLELDALFRVGQTRDLPMLDAATAGSFTAEESRGGLLQGSAIVDHRDDRVEATDGWLLGATGQYSPGGALGDHRWLQLTTDARLLVPVKESISVGLRVGTGWVLAADDNGVPLGPRLFGGGAYGNRGYGRDRLAPAAIDAMGSEVLIGGRSLVEASAELRFLPYRKQVGAVAFLDLGGAGEALNPFEQGVALAAGIGGRVRLWYVPIAIDIGYRILDESDPGLSLSRVQGFLRIGEAF
jgi:outer membrane protein assembly factor BamA